jgi:hypothetical protein
VQGDVLGNHPFGDAIQHNHRQSDQKMVPAH